MRGEHQTTSDDGPGVTLSPMDFHRFQVQPICSDLRPGAPFPACTLPVSMRTITLFLHDGGSVGLQQALVGARTRPYSLQEYKTQFSQLENDPQSALAGIPALLVAHTVSSINQDTPWEAVLYPSVGSPQEDACMHHLQLEDAAELLERISDKANPIRPPNFLDMSEPCHVLAWALFLMDQMEPVHLYTKLLEWQAEKYSQPLPHPADDLSEVELYKRSHAVLLLLTVIRLSIVEALRRVKTSSYSFSELAESIGLPTGTELGTAASRDAVRKTLRAVCHPVQVFVPARANQHAGVRPSGVFSQSDVAVCNRIAVERQSNIENASTLSLCDKMCSFARSQAACFPEPWQNNNAKYLLDEHKRSVKLIYPPGTDKSRVLGVQYLTKVRDTAEFSMRKLFEHKLKIMGTGQERIRYSNQFFPGYFQARMQDHLSGVKFRDWETFAGTKNGLRRPTLQQHSLTLVAYFSFCFGNFGTTHCINTLTIGNHVTMPYSTTQPLIYLKMSNTTRPWLSCCQKISSCRQWRCFARSKNGRSPLKRPRSGAIGRNTSASVPFTRSWWSCTPTKIYRCSRVARFLWCGRSFFCCVV